MFRGWGWHQVLKRRLSGNDSITVLDQGPIYRLVFMREFGPEFTNSNVYTRWRNSMLNQWAATLHIVIWLDAPDAVLFQRINSRTEEHRVKECLNKTCANFSDVTEPLMSRLSGK